MRNLPPRSVLLLSVDPARASDIYVLVLTAIQRSGSVGILVVTIRPYAWWAKIAKEKGLDLERIRFVNCVEKLETSEDPNVRHTGIEDLDSTREVISEFVSAEPPEHTVVVLDSPTAIRFYHSEKETEEFVFWFKTQIDKWGVRGLIIYPGSACPELLEHILGLVDRRAVI